MTIIGSISITPERVVPGQSFLVEVLGQDGEPLANQAATVVRVNGIVGAHQYLQYPWAGDHRLSISAWREGEPSETTEATVSVIANDVELPAEHPGLKFRLLSLAPEVGLPLLRISHTPNSPTTVGLAVGRGSRFLAGLTSGLLGEVADQRGRARLRIDGRELSMLSHVTDTGLLATLPPHLAEPPAAPSTMYHWDFGDGSTVSSTEGSMEHDYAPALGADDEHRLFEVRVRIERQGQDAVEVVRTLSVFNAYAICKRLGTIVPRVNTSSYARKLLSGYTLTVTVDNIEDVPITLTHRLITPVLDDGNDLAQPTVSEPLSPPLTVPAHGSLAVTVTTGAGAVPKEANAIAVLFAGTTERGEAVRVEAHADISHEDRVSDGLKVGRLAVTHWKPFQSAVRAVDEQIHDPQAVEHPVETPFNGPLIRLDGNHFGFDRPAPFMHLRQTTPALRSTALEVMQRAADPSFSSVMIRQVDVLQSPLAGAASALTDQVSLQPPGSADAGWANVRQLMDARLISPHAFDMAIVQAPEEGKECDPDNLPDDLTDWVCQATPEKREVIMPGRFMNARKGDIVVSPGGMGPIGGLLRQVMPPQRYSHSGIMTRNYDTITHSTASEDRLMAYPVGSIAGDPAPTEGHRPDIVQYGWPGVVTQPVEQAIHGSDMVDPESGKPYSISSFSARNQFMEIGGVWEIVPPLVVKPDPMQETPELRRTLHRIADAAMEATGKSHYRFYCYTDPTIGQTSVAPAEAGWAAGTFPSVCSSFVWLAVSRAGARLEGSAPLVTQADLEPLDVAAGAQRDDQTRDGLYLYTAAERRAAADFLFNYLHEKVRSKEGEKGLLGELAEAFSDMADDVANQMVNAFSSDWCATEAKDSDAWQDTVNANAVSPDNILLWDGPASGGLYGFAAPLVYREPRREVLTVHKWKLVPTKGTLTGTVRSNGAPVAAAMVQLYDGMTDFTDAQGQYRLENVPFGNYEIKAAKDNGPVYLSASTPVSIGTASVTQDVELTPPSEDFRVVKISGNIHMLDYEDVGSDESGDQPLYAELFIGPYGTHAEHTFVGKCGGEVRVEFRVVVDWQLDRSVGIWYEHKFFEGGSEDTDDLDGYTSNGLGLGAGFWQAWNSDIKSGGAGESHVSVTFENALNPN